MKQQQHSVRVGIPVQAKADSNTEMDEKPPRPSVTIHRSGSIDIRSSHGLNIEVSSSKNGQNRSITTTAVTRDATNEDSEITDEDNDAEDLFQQMDIPSPAPTWKANTQGESMLLLNYTHDCMPHFTCLFHDAAKAAEVAAEHRTTTKKETPDVSQPVDLSQYISPSKTLLADTSDDTAASELDAEVGGAFDDVVDEHAIHTATVSATKLVSELRTPEVDEKHEGTTDGTTEAKQEDKKFPQISLSGASNIVACGNSVDSPRK